MEFLSSLLYKAQRKLAGLPPLPSASKLDPTQDQADEPDQEESAFPATVDELAKHSLSPHLVEELRAFLAAYVPAPVPTPKSEQVDVCGSNAEEEEVLARALPALVADDPDS